MNFWQKQRNLYWLIAFLLITNIATISTVLYHKSKFDKRKYKWLHEGSKSKHQKHRLNDKCMPIDNIFSKELSLTEEQQAIFVKERMLYYSQVDSLLDVMRTHRWEFVSQLSSTPPDTLLLENLAEHYGSLHTKMKIHTMYFYWKLKNLCNPEQHKKLDKLFKRLVKHSTQRKKHKKHN